MSSFVKGSSLSSSRIGRHTSTEVLQASTSASSQGNPAHASSNAIPIGVGVGVGLAAAVTLANFLYFLRRRSQRRSARADRGSGTIVYVNDNDKEMVAAVSQQRSKNVLQHKNMTEPPEYHAYESITRK